MSTSVRAVTSSIAPQIGSPIGGARPSVSSSIKMISIGPEGGRARVDTSFGSPFARMKPSNPSLNSGKIFGENGTSKPRSAESVFGPKIGSVKIDKPTYTVRFTPDLASKVDAVKTFAGARAGGVYLSNPEGLQSSKEKINPIKKAERPQIKLGLNELASAIATYKTVTARQVEVSTQIRKTVEAIEAKPFRMPETFKSTNALPQDIAPTRIESQARQPVAEGLSQKQQDLLVAMTPLIKEVTPAMKDRKLQTAGFSQETARQIRIFSEGFKLTNPEGLQNQSEITPEQTASLANLRPLVENGILTKQEAFKKAGVSVEVVQKLEIPARTTAPEKAVLLPDLQVQKAVQFIKILEKSTTPKARTETEPALQQKAQSLVQIVRQTYQLEALGNPEAEIRGIVQKQIASAGILPQDQQQELALMVIRSVKKIKTEQAAVKTSEMQLDPEATKARVKVGTEAIENAPTNEKGEISADSVSAALVREYKNPVLSNLVKKMGRSVDGGYDRIIKIVQAAGRLKPTEMAKILDNAIDDNPAVEPVEEKNTRPVGPEDVARVLDRSLQELIKSILGTSQISKLSTTTS